jgi:hypothetical protein
VAPEASPRALLTQHKVATGRSYLLDLNKAISNPTKHSFTKKEKKQGMCHIVALPFTLKSNYLKAQEEELWKLKYYFTMQKYINHQKNPLEETKILQDIIITL